MEQPPADHCLYKKFRYGDNLLLTSGERRKRRDHCCCQDYNDCRRVQGEGERREDGEGAGRGGGLMRARSPFYNTGRSKIPHMAWH